MPAQGPSPASSYDVLDDVVAKLSNTSAFPLTQETRFYWSRGGAQMLVRYAAVMRSQSSAASISFRPGQSGIVSVSHRDAAVSDRTGLPRSALPRILR